MKKHWHIWVGIGAIVLSVLIVLGTVFLPRLAAKSDMKDVLALAAAPDAEYVRLVDPTFEHEGILAGVGREVALSGAQLDDVRAALAAFAKDFSYEKKGNDLAGAMGLHLLIKTAEGEIVKIYFNESSFYCVLNGNACYFSADDAQGYANFYANLQAAFS